MPKTPVYFDKQVAIRFAPLQLKLINYCLEKFPYVYGQPDGFKDTSDFVRRSITLQAKELLSEQEFELMCNMAFKEVDPRIE